MPRACYLISTVSQTLVIAAHITLVHNGSNGHRRSTVINDTSKSVRCSGMRMSVGGDPQEKRASMLRGEPETRA